MKILFSNLGYLRGISGTLAHHLLFAHRHFYCSASIQDQVWQQLTAIIANERPDICCFVEIEQAAFHKENFHTLEDITGESFPFFDIENKYGYTSHLRSLPLTRGKSNAFLAKQKFTYEKIHFSYGTKRLIYKIELANRVTLFFAHFSLNQKTRAKQLLETRQLINDTPGEVIFLGDFNILGGFKELEPLLQDNLVLLNDEAQTTFTFHSMRKTLDICVCTPNIARQSRLHIIPQPYSDHDALLLDIGD